MKSLHIHSYNNNFPCAANKLSKLDLNGALEIVLLTFFLICV